MLIERPDKQKRFAIRNRINGICHLAKFKNIVYNTSKRKYLWYGVRNI